MPERLAMNKQSSLFGPLSWHHVLWHCHQVDLLNDLGAGLGAPGSGAAHERVGLVVAGGLRPAVLPVVVVPHLEKVVFNLLKIHTRTLRSLYHINLYIIQLFIAHFHFIAFRGYKTFYYCNLLNQKAVFWLTKMYFLRLQKGSNKNQLSKLIF